MTRNNSLNSFIASMTNPFTVARDFLLPQTNGKPPVDINRMRTIKENDIQLQTIWFPTKKNVSYLQKKYHFHPTHLDDVVSLLQRPKIDIEENYIFFVMHFPEYNEETKKIESNEIDFFLTGRDVIVIINHDFPYLDDLLNRLAKNKKERTELFTHGSGFVLYHLIDTLIDSIFPLVEQVEKALEVIDHDVFTKQPRVVARQISFLRRNVTYFQTIMKPQVNSFISFLDTKHPLMNKELRAYFANISDHLKKIWDRLEDVDELSDNLSRTFESYLSFKTNETIKILTVFSATLLPLTFITGLYGMNLSFLPLANHPQALIVIVSGMCVIAGGMLAGFRWRGWI